MVREMEEPRAKEDLPRLASRVRGSAVRNGQEAGNEQKKIWEERREIQKARGFVDLFQFWRLKSKD
jgi:hypothetical protein